MNAPSPGVWASYLARYHDEHAGITEEVLSVARDETGRSPYDWLLEAVPDRGLVVDIGCGSAPVARRLGGRVRYVGVDRSAAELRRARGDAAGCTPVARADAAVLPLPPAAADAVVASMMLMVVPDVDAVLAEVGRVLRVGGRLVVTVPVRGADDSPSTDVFREVLAALGQGHVTYPGSLKPSTLTSRLAAAAGLHLLEDTCGRFARTVGPEDCELMVDSFYAVGASPDQGAEALALLRARAEVEPFPLTYPIRRVVAIRGDG